VSMLHVPVRLGRGRVLMARGNGVILLLELLLHRNALVSVAILLGVLVALHLRFERIVNTLSLWDLLVVVLRVAEIVHGQVGAHRHALMHSAAGACGRQTVSSVLLAVYSAGNGTALSVSRR
jgi:hypothetical protein